MDDKRQFTLGPFGFMGLSLIIWGLIVGIVTDTWQEWLGWVLLYLVSDVLLFLTMWMLAASSIKKRERQ